MIFSNTAVCSLSSLLVVAMAASTTSGVGGATTTNWLSKRSLHRPQRSVCPRRCIIKWRSIIHLDHDTLCKHFWRQPRWTLWARLKKNMRPRGFLHRWYLYQFQHIVATLALSEKVVNVNDDGEEASVITGSIIYDGTNTELNFGGYFFWGGI